MATGQSLEDRLKLVHEIFLVISHNDRVKTHSSPQVSSYWLVRAILLDEPFSCTSTQALISVLKKSPVWNILKPFLFNANTLCGRKDCRDGSWSHETPDNRCTASHYRMVDGKYVSIACKCPKFVKREF